jgi:hypothetical protein
MSQGEYVWEELDAVEALEVSQERPGTTDAATATSAIVRNPSTRSIAIASPPPQLDAPEQTPTSSSVLVVRSERPPVESSNPSRVGAAAATEAASVAWMLCELKTKMTTTTKTALEDSSAFVTPSIP